MSGLSSNKKILLTVVAFILVIAALVGVLLVVDSSPNKKEPETTSSALPSLPSLPSVDSEFNTDENASSAFSHDVSTTSSSSEANPAVMTEVQLQCVQAFLSGTYYISASLVSDNASSDMDMAVRGKDFQATMESNGMVLTVMIIDSKVYFVNDATRTYFEMSKTLMSTMGIDIEDLTKMLDEIDFSEYKFTSVDKTTEELDGTSVECFKYYNDEIAITFKFDGNELKQIVFSDVQGNAASKMIVKDYTPYVPTGMLTLSGLKKSSNMISFFMDLAK